MTSLEWISGISVYNRGQSLSVAYIFFWLMYGSDQLIRWLYDLHRVHVLKTDLARSREVA